MLNRSLKSIVSSGSAALVVASLGTLGAVAESRSCSDLRSDIAAVRFALGIVDGKVDQSNRSSASIWHALEAVGGKVDQTNQSNAAIRLALGVLDGKVDHSNADLAILRAELQRVRETLQAMPQVNGRLQLEVAVDETSCASGAIQCASLLLPSGDNQNPVELKILVQRDQVTVTNLEIADFEMTVAFAPERGPDVVHCALRVTGCGSPDYFINRGNGGYQLWVHPPAGNWMSGTYALLIRVTDTDGNVATKLVNVFIAEGAPRVPDPITGGPGLGLDVDDRELDVVDDVVDETGAGDVDDDNN